MIWKVELYKIYIKYDDDGVQESLYFDLGINRRLCRRKRLYQKQT